MTLDMLSTPISELMERWDEIEAPCPKCGDYFLADKFKVTEKAGAPIDMKLTFLCGNNHPTYIRSLNSMVAFRRLCSKVSRAYAKGEFSSTEKRIKRILEKFNLFENTDWVHNFPIICHVNGSLRRYKIDFNFTHREKGIEGDGSVWHTLWGVRRKDSIRDRAIWKQHGIRILRLDSKLTDSEMEDKVGSFLFYGQGGFSDV